MISVPHKSTLLGLDVHKPTIAAGALAHDADVLVVDQISSNPQSVRRLVGQFPDPRHLVACYEAGSTGYEPGVLRTALLVDTAQGLLCRGRRDYFRPN
jgi:hypothetical protein